MAFSYVHTAAMSPELVSWEFIYAGNNLWAWRSAQGYAAPFASLANAKENAAGRGFDPLTQYWVAICCGRITHNRPGQEPFSEPCGEAPTALERARRVRVIQPS